MYFTILLAKPKITKAGSLQLFQTEVMKTTKLECVVEYSLPRPNITWEYQPWPCLNMSRAANCKPVEKKWRKIPSHIGRITHKDYEDSRNSYKVTVSADGNELSSFFRCRAQNVLGSDEIVYALKRYGMFLL